MGPNLYRWIPKTKHTNRCTQTLGSTRGASRKSSLDTNCRTRLTGCLDLDRAGHECDHNFCYARIVLRGVVYNFLRGPRINICDAARMFSARLCCLSPMANLGFGYPIGRSIIGTVSARFGGQHLFSLVVVSAEGGECFLTNRCTRAWSLGGIVPRFTYSPVIVAQPVWADESSSSSSTAKRRWLGYRKGPR